MTHSEEMLALICKLPEIEFAEILRGMADHIDRERLEHLIDQSFSIETYQSELEDAERELEDLTNEKDELIDKIDSVLALCDKFSANNDDAQGYIDKIRDRIQ